MKNTPQLRSYFKGLCALVSAAVVLLIQSASATPIITSVVETGGDNEATDTITAKWSGVTYNATIAGEPVPGLALGAPYTVGLFGDHTPGYVDRVHRFTNASAVLPMPGYLVGGEYVIHGQDNRDNNPYTLDVTTSRDVQAYLLIDNRVGDNNNANPPTLGPVMQWVLDDGWMPVIKNGNRAGNPALPDEIGIDENADGTRDQFFSVYTKRFSAGTFRTKEQNNTTGRDNYGLVVTPASLALPNALNIGGNKVGSVTDNGGGSFTVVGGGNDIWDDRDEMTFAYTEVTGDFDVQVRADSFTPNARWSKAGLMARESLSEYGRMAFVRVAPADVPTSNGGNGANDTRFQYRTGLDNSAGASGGVHEELIGGNTIGAANFPNGWLRLSRIGNVVFASNSLDDVAWQLVGTQDTATWGGGALPATLNLGLAASRHSGGPTATAEFRSLQFNYGAAFDVRGASSRGNPNGIVVSFSKPVGSGAYLPGSYTVDGGITVTDVVDGPSATSVRLVTSALTEGTTYTVTAAGVSALDSTALGVATASFVHGAGYEANAIVLQHNKTQDSGYYRNSDAVAKGLGTLIHNGGGGVYPASVSHTLFEDNVPDNGANERYSTRISGVLNITASGNYNFACSSDDQGYLYLSTDEQSANKVQIAFEPAWNGSRSYTTQDRRGASQNRAGPIALVTGNKNYIEYAYTEGGGGNNGSATWQPPGAPAIVAGQSPIPASAFMPSRMLNGTTFTALGPVMITQNPAALTVPALTPATFRVKADGTPGYTYQWRRNGINIPGATGSSYTIPATQLADDAVLFSVVVANSFSSAISSGALLTVLSPTPPGLVSAQVDTTFTRVTARFNNRLQPATANVAGNYSIPGTVVMTATRDASGRNVVLVVSPALAEGTTYTPDRQWCV